MRNIRTTEVAKMVRDYLKTTHREYKFSVRKDGWSSIIVTIPTDFRETHGQIGLYQELNRFTGGGFDGMIDMSYYWTNWFHDNQLYLANSKGTEGSRGSCAPFAHPAPHPDAEEVRVDTQYIMVQ